MEVSRNGGTPKSIVEFMEHPNQNWMICGYPHDYGNPKICPHDGTCWTNFYGDQIPTPKASWICVHLVNITRTTGKWMIVSLYMNFR